MLALSVTKLQHPAPGVQSPMSARWDICIAAHGWIHEFFRFAAAFSHFMIFFRFTPYKENGNDAKPCHGSMVSGVLPPEVRVPDQLGTEATVNLYNLTQYSLLFSKALAIS